MSDATSGPGPEDLDVGYAAMAADVEREAEALEWIESAPDDGIDDEAEDWSWLMVQHSGQD